MNQLLHNIGSYHVETSPLVCRENQWTGFYMIEICHERVNGSH